MEGRVIEPELQPDGQYQETGDSGRAPWPAATTLKAGARYVLRDEDEAVGRSRLWEILCVCRER
jgi:hypothetical protein